MGNTPKLVYVSRSRGAARMRNVITVTSYPSPAPVRTRARPACGVSRSPSPSPRPAVELRSLDGVIPLLVLPEPEQVRHVRRAPAVEVKFVLGDDGLQELFALVQLSSADDSPL